MLFEDSSISLETLVAKSANITNKPFIHSVVITKGEYNSDLKDIDLVLHVLCRDKEGIRITNNDIELEMFQSNNQLVLVVSKLNYPEEPILWFGPKSLWMDSGNGKLCKPPRYSFYFENFASRIKNCLD